MDQVAPVPGETAAGHKQTADLAVQRGDLTAARTALERAVALDRGSVDLWMSLAGCCRALGDIAAAGAAVEAALRVEPRSFIALLMKASLLERAGQTRAASLAY